MKKILMVVTLLMFTLILLSSKPKQVNSTNNSVYINDTVVVDSTKILLQKQQAELDSLLNLK